MNDFLKNINSVGGVLVGLINFLLKKILIASVFYLVVYILSPSMFKWILFKVGVFYNDLDMLEEIEIKNENISKLEEEMIELKAEKDSIEKELVMAKSEKEGLFQGIRYLKYEQSNWYGVVILSISVVIVGGMVYYCFFDVSTSELFKPLINHISSVGIELSKSLSENMIVNVKNVDEKIELLEIKLEIIENFMKVINEKLNKK